MDEHIFEKLHLINRNMEFLVSELVLHNDKMDKLIEILEKQSK